MKVGDPRWSGRLRQTDLLLALVALSGVLALGVELGLAIAVVTSLLPRSGMPAEGASRRWPIADRVRLCIDGPRHRPSPGTLVLQPR